MKTPPLSPELEALLAPLRAVAPLAPSIEARAMARAVAAAPEPHAVGRVLTAPRWVFAAPRWAFAAAAGVMLAVGAGAYAARGLIDTASPRTSAEPRPIAPPRASEPRPSIAVPAAPEAETTTIAPRARHAVAKTRATAPTNAELQLLRDARQDVTRGDFTRALAVIAEHVRRFRNGALVEEREALRVKALEGVGRHDDAQRAAARFHARFPHSVFLPTFEHLKGAGG